MPSYAGNLGTHNNNTATVVRAVVRKVAEEEPSNTPLFSLTEAMGRKGSGFKPKEKNWKIEWFNKRRFERFIELTSAGTGTNWIASATSLPNIQIGTVFEYGKENSLCVGVNRTTGAITVLRNTPQRPGGGIVNIPAGSKVRIVSNAAEQGAPKGARFGILPTEDYNLTQIFRRGCGITKTEMAVSKYTTSNEFKQLIRDNFSAMKEDIERAILMHWGRQLLSPGGGGADNNSRNIMGGLPYYIRDNFVNVGGTLTYEALNQFMARVIRYGGSRRRLIMGGQKFMAVIAGFPKEAIRTTIQNDFWGQEIRRLGGSSSWRAETLENWQLDDGGFWSGVFYALDMGYIARYNLREAHIDEDAVDKGTDAMEAELIIELTIIVQNPRAHMMAYNLQN